MSTGEQHYHTLPYQLTPHTLCLDPCSWESPLSFLNTAILHSTPEIKPQVVSFRFLAYTPPPQPCIGEPVVSPPAPLTHIHCLPELPHAASLHDHLKLSHKYSVSCFWPTPHPPPCSLKCSTPNPLPCYLLTPTASQHGPTLHFFRVRMKPSYKPPVNPMCTFQLEVVTYAFTTSK